MKDFLVIAHRGASRVAPENTVPAFRMAMVLKADMIETDVRLSLDKVPVIAHDPTLERITGDKVPIDYLTLRELREHDFGAWFSEEFAATQIPTLEDALYFAKGDIPLNLEIKKDSPRSHGIEERVLEVIAEKDMEDQVLISSFDSGALRIVRRLRPNIRIGLLYNGKEPWKPLLDLAGELKVTSFHPQEASVTLAMVLAFHNSDIRIYPYVVDNKERVEALQKWEVDGVFTNCPEIFLEEA